MADLICPVCGERNPENSEKCQNCGSDLSQAANSRPANPPSLKLGVEPVKKGTAEFEKVDLHGDRTIHPGEAPTKKNTAELEHALPSWLRSLRGEKPPAGGDSLAQPSKDKNPPADSAPALAPEPVEDGKDWLAGLGEAAEAKEEIPEWLAGLRGINLTESTPAAEETEPASPLEDTSNWMGRLGDETEPAATEFPAGGSPLLPESPAVETNAGLAAGDESPDWLKSLQSSPSGEPEPPQTTSGEGSLPNWLSGLPETPPEATPPAQEEPVPAPSEAVPDWLDRLAKKPDQPEPEKPAAQETPIPDWLSSFGSASATPEAPPAEDVPDWLTNLESKSEPDAGTPAPSSREQDMPADILPGEMPGWLSRLQTDASAVRNEEPSEGVFGTVSKVPVSQRGTGPLPDWLTKIEPAETPSDSMPALIEDGSENSPDEPGETAYSMGTPEWLSRLNPEQASEKTAENDEGQADSGSLSTSELPSWVQAMRPVESVVDSRTAQLEDSQVTEQSGPLAGLRGVLPAGPGLGSMRKPPAYSSKLQVSDGQHRYASFLEQLVVGEANPQTVPTPRLSSNRLWRWLITFVLLLAVGLPLLKGAQVASPTLLGSSDDYASSRIIDALAGNVPVLVAFDYDPALSGELEAVAAPLMDQVLSKGIPLVLVSTSPTGPALAEHFLHNAPLINVYLSQSGEQYFNLGYLAGGPAGLLYFADAPTSAMPLTVDGANAWNSGPLQGIHELSDFAAVIVLTDNADTGRIWIEQAGPHLGNKPMLMMISAQAEPMIRPYFDSGQIKGLVSGLSDAKIYEQKYGRPGLANHYWDSFKIGMLFAELLIAAGAIYGVVIDQRARRKETREKA